MDSADLHDVEFVWPSAGPKDVIVTGTFDQWSSSIHLAKGDAGFSGTVRVPWGEKIAFKYIVDGYWRCRDDMPSENDGSGNINNVLHVPPKPVTPVRVAPVPAPEEVPAPVSTGVTATTDLEKDASLPGGPWADLPVEEPATSIASPPATVPSQVPEPSPQIAPVIPITILPVNDSTIIDFTPFPAPERQSEPPAMLEVRLPDGNSTADGVSTLTPVQFSKLESGTSPPVPVLTVTEPSKQETEPSAESAPIEHGQVVADILPEASAQQSDDKPSLDKPIIAHAEPSVPESADLSPPPTAPPSKIDSVPRKKRRSLFGKLRDIFSDKNKSKGKKNRV